VSILRTDPFKADTGTDETRNAEAMMRIIGERYDEVVLTV